MEQPKYHRIADTIRQLIRSLPPGEALPPDARLMETYKVARPTLRKALAELENEGLLAGVRPRRVAGWEPIPIHLARLADWTWADEGATAGADAWVGDMQRAGMKIRQEIDVSARTAGQPAASRLEISRYDLVVMRRLTRFADGEPHNMITFWFPLAVAEGTLLQRDASIAEGSVSWLEKTYGKLAHQARLGARTPAADEKIALKIRQGVPVITVWRVARSPDRPVMCSLAVYPADRTELLVDP